MTKISFRAPEDLRALLEKSAEKNERKLTQEIIYRLKRSLREEQKKSA